MWFRVNPDTEIAEFRQTEHIVDFAEVSETREGVNVTMDNGDKFFLTINQLDEIYEGLSLKPNSEASTRGL